MFTDISKIFERVIEKIGKGSGLIKDKVEDVPSAFLVKVNNTRKFDKSTYKQLIKENKKNSKDDDEPDPDFEGKMDELGEYVEEISSKGRNREKIKAKGTSARKSSGKKAIAGR